LNSSVPIEGNGIIPVAPADVAGVPAIALTIPDFEAQAIIRIFANSTQSEIACYSAIMKNGHTFSHPAAVGSTIGAFVAIALISSVAVAVYGQHAPETRNHSAHSLSLFVVFSVLQHIFFTGALSVNWPSVLPAFWSNFAWSAGMIYSERMQNSIDHFTGSNRGNISMVGSAPSGVNSPGLGGGYSLSQIYKRDVDRRFEPFTGTGGAFSSNEFEHSLMRRELVNSSSGFSWYGNQVGPGLPLPGNFSSFAGTLAQVNIPASNAFMTGLLWLLILIAIVGVGMMLLKLVIEAFAAIRLVKTDRLSLFRRHWLSFTAQIVLRTCFIAFFMMMLLALFQFTLGGSAGVVAVAAVVFTVFVVGLLGASAYALYYRLRHAKLERNAGVPSDSREKPRRFRAPLHFVDQGSERPHVHDDEDYIKKFGWLASRFRRSKWWFFSFWLIYELVRACFYGGAAGHPLVQVFGLLVWEIISLVAIFILRPFESSRLNWLMVYMLGFSKVATVALSAAFDTRFGLDRILTTVIGVIIIVIQGLLTVCLLIFIVIGAVSSYMSISRNHEKIKPSSLEKPRTRYYAHIQQKATDKPAPPPPPPPPEPETPKEPYFAVSTVRRERKIEDEHEEADVDEYGFEDQRMSMEPDHEVRNISNRRSCTASIQSRKSASNLPYGARRNRASWSTRDFQDFELEQGFIPSGMQSRVSVDSAHDTPGRPRASSTRGPSRNGTPVGINPPLNGSDVHINRTRNRRSTSNAEWPMRNSSVVNEEHEYEHLVRRE